jgi:polar amino acid transport system substrate-binding protein
MKLRPFLAASLTAAVLAAALAGCSATSDAGSGGSASPSGDANPYHLITPGVIQAAVSGAQPPFDQADASGKPEGFNIDLIERAAKALHLKMEYRTTSAPAGIQGLSSKQYDMVVDGLGVTPERQQSILFTKGIYWATTAFMTNKSSSVHEPADLSGKHVAVVTGTVQVGYLAKIKGAVPVEFDTPNAAVSALNSGTVDAFIIGAPSTPAYIAQFPSLKVAATEPVDHATAMAAQLGNTALVDAINKQFGKLVDDGTFLKLYTKYFHEKPSPELVKIWPKLKR